MTRAEESGVMWLVVAQLLSNHFRSVRTHDSPEICLTKTSSKWISRLPVYDKVHLHAVAMLNHIHIRVR